MGFIAGIKNKSVSTYDQPSAGSGFVPGGPSPFIFDTVTGRVNIVPNRDPNVTPNPNRDTSKIGIFIASSDTSGPPPNPPVQPGATANFVGLLWGDQNSAGGLSGAGDYAGSGGFSCFAQAKADIAFGNTNVTNGQPVNVPLTVDITGVVNGGAVSLGYFNFSGKAGAFSAGVANAANGFASIAENLHNKSDGNWSRAYGFNAHTVRAAQQALSGGGFTGNADGEAQLSTQPLQGQVVGGGVVNLTIPDLDPSGNIIQTQLNLEPGKAYNFMLKVVAQSSSGTNYGMAVFNVPLFLQWQGGNILNLGVNMAPIVVETVPVPSPVATCSAGNAANWFLTISDAGGGILNIQFSTGGSPDTVNISGGMFSPEVVAPL
jgi:hypothetical protein